MGKIVVETGLNRKGFTSGLDGMKGEANAFKESFSKSIAGAIGGAAIATALQAMIEKFSRIHDLGQRFGETAESIQRVDYAAGLAGGNIEFIAKTVGKLTIAANKNATALDENKDSFVRIGISSKEFIGLPLEEKLIRLSTAYKAAEGDQQKMADLMTVLGNKAGDLIPLLADGPEALRATFAEAAVATQSNVDSVEALGDNIDKLKNQGVPVFSFLVTVLRDAGVIIDELGNQIGIGLTMRINFCNAAVDALGNAFDALKRGDFSGVSKAFADGEKVYNKIKADAEAEADQSWNQAKKNLDEINHPGPSQRPKGKTQIDDDEAAAAREESKDKGEKADIARADREKKRDEDKAQRDQAAADKQAEHDEAAEAREEARREKENNSAAQDLLNEKAKTEALQLRLDGREQEAKLVETAAEYDLQIEEVYQKIREAADDNNTALALTLSNKKSELETQKQLALETIKQADAEKDIQATVEATNAEKRAAGQAYKDSPDAYKTSPDAYDKTGKSRTREDMAAKTDAFNAGSASLALANAAGAQQILKSGVFDKFLKGQLNNPNPITPSDIVTAIANGLGTSDAAFASAQSLRKATDRGSGLSFIEQIRFNSLKDAEVQRQAKATAAIPVKPKPSDQASIAAFLAGSRNGDIATYGRDQLSKLTEIQTSLDIIQREGLLR